MNFIHSFIQAVLLVTLAPLLSGLITKIKNFLRLRKGQGILQPYSNLRKLFSKQEVVSENSSWILIVTPYIVFAAMFAAILLLPLFVQAGVLQTSGDLIAIIFLFALGRFFLALAGLDTASTFGGMGSSREMFISSFVEPGLILAVLAVALNSGSTNLSLINNYPHLNISVALAVIALFLAVLAETGRLPIDNQETHLELTMIHEAMVLEYSGRSLALLELAAYIKQIFFFSLLAWLILPGALFTPLGYGAVLLGVSILIALVEVSIAKMRLFRVTDFLFFSGVLAVLAIVAAVMGA